MVLYIYILVMFILILMFNLIKLIDQTCNESAVHSMFCTNTNSMLQHCIKMFYKKLKNFEIHNSTVTFIFTCRAFYDTLVTVVQMKIYQLLLLYQAIKSRIYHQFWKKNKGRAILPNKLVIFQYIGKKF